MSIISAYQALLLCKWNRLDEANALAREAMQLAEQGQMALLEGTIAYSSLLKLAHARGEPEMAKAALECAEHFVKPMTSRLFEAVHILVDQVRLCLMQEDLNQALEVVERLRLQPRTSSILIYEREMVAEARVLLAQQKPGEVLLLLTPLLTEASRQERWKNALELRLLLAQAHSMRHEEQEACAMLAEAVRLAQPEGYIRSFVDEGEPIAMLLSALQASQGEP